MKPAEDSRCRFAIPSAFCASSTIGSGGRFGFSVRNRLIWQPMIGCTPLPLQYWLNSSAPNRLPVSVIATAGIPAACASPAILSTLMAPSLSE